MKIRSCILDDAYFSACGHDNYIISVWLYLQQMNNLEHKSPQVYQDLMEGYHVADQTEGHTWGGASSDHIIEDSQEKNTFLVISINGRVT